MTKLEELAAFAHSKGDADLLPEHRETLKIHVLDTLGCAIGALDGTPIRQGRRVVDALGGAPECTLIGGGKTSLPQAAFYNGALVRYLDFMDTRIGKHGECHPCDNLAALLAAAEMRGRSGAEFLTTLAVSYQILGRMSEATTVVQRGFDHTLSLTFAVAAGASRLLGLDQDATRRALAIAGADAPGSMATRTEPISNWKGIASAECAYRATFCTLLAAEGIDGPPMLFEGPQGLMMMAGDEFQVVWSQEGLDVVSRTLIKKYNAEARSQSAIDALLTLRRENGLSGEDVDRVEIETFKSSFDNLGGGRYGPKDFVTRKEQADHNLRYIAAVALIDGAVEPAQYAQARIEAPDVQALMEKVAVKPNDAFTNAEPDQQGTRVAIQLKDGRTLVREQTDYEGFPTRPATWGGVEEKFHRLTTPYLQTSVAKEIVTGIKSLETIPVRELTALLARARPSPA